MSLWDYVTRRGSEPPPETPGDSVADAPTDPVGTFRERQAAFVQALREHVETQKPASPPSWTLSPVDEAAEDMVLEELARLTARRTPREAALYLFDSPQGRRHR